MIYLYLGILLVVSSVFTVRYLTSHFGPIKTVRAVVVHKQKVEPVSQYAPTGKRIRYAVTFEADGKRLSFYVSELSYQGFRKGERGTLKYRGDRLIDFS